MNCLRPLIICFLMVFLLGNKTWGKYTILLDPGHGGAESGAFRDYRKKMGKKVRIFEKDIVLELSKRIYKKLKAKKYRTFLSRSIDRTVPLHERASLVKRINPDIYISIHANSSKEETAKGFETYYLDNHNDVAVKKLEEVENKNLIGQDLVVNQILSDLVIRKTVKSSRSLAHMVHREIQKTIKNPFQMVDRGVRPGFFYVLTLAKRPSILLEVGFLSNPKDLRKLLDPRFQDRYAEAVVRGIDRYVKTSL